MSQYTHLSEMKQDDVDLIMKQMRAHCQKLPDILLNLLTELHEDSAFTVDRLTHSLQTATRAYKDDADEELIVVALLHDIGESLSPFNHAEVAAALLKPYISDDNHWLLKHHDIFQGYYFWDKIGMDKHAREQFRGHPMFERTALFCERWDAPSFDPNYETLPLEFFEPMVKRVLVNKR